MRWCRPDGGVAAPLPGPAALPSVAAMTATPPLTSPTDDDRNARRRSRISSAGEWVGMFGAIMNVGLFEEDVSWLGIRYGDSWADISALAAHHHLPAFAGAWFWFAGWIALAVAVLLVAAVRFLPVRGRRGWQVLACTAALGVGAAHVVATLSVRGLGELSTHLNYGFYSAVAGCVLLAVGALIPTDRIGDEPTQ